MNQFFGAFPIIYTADLRKAVAFYRDLLGFEETFRFPTSGEPEFVALKLNGGGNLGLTATREGQTGAHGWPITPHSGGFELCVYTDDVDTAVTQLRARGVLVLREPEDQRWNERMAYVADPDDHPIMLCQRLASGGTSGQDSARDSAQD
jgi:lactoylglutathione lyase